MGCAASTQDDTVAPANNGRQHRARPAGTAPDDFQARTLLRGGALPQVSGSFAALDDGTPRGHDGAATSRYDLVRQSTESEVNTNVHDSAVAFISPSQVRVNKKLQMSSSTHGRTLCSVELVDALPRFLCPSVQHCPTTQPHKAPQRPALCAATATASSGTPEKEGSMMCMADGEHRYLTADAASPNGLLVSPTRSQNSQAASRDCSICLMGLCGTEVVTMACLHTFHYHCARVWLSQHDGSCPDCRTKVCVDDFSFPNEIDGDHELAQEAQQRECDHERQQLEDAERTRNVAVVLARELADEDAVLVGA